MKKVLCAIVLSIVGILATQGAPLAPALPASAQTEYDCSLATGIGQTECEALVALYESTDGENWTDNTDWLVTNTPCSWYGVTCTLGSITSIDLRANRLSGEIPSQIGDFPSLQYLILQDNSLTGGIPPDIGDLSQLWILVLGGNQLSGAIPAEIGNLGRLTNLDLWDNQLSGTIPSQIGSLTSLWWLQLQDNQLSGTIPSTIGNLNRTWGVYLSNNQLSGVIPPEIGTMVELEHLSLSNNQLSGQIPSTIGNLTALTHLDLAINRLEGPIPPEIGDLIALEYLYLYINRLTGPIPGKVGNLTALRSLNLVNNPLGGPIPTEIGNLTSLQHLWLYNTQITGTIPSTIGNLTALQSLYLASNHLEGPIPPEIGNLTALQDLYLWNNELTGPIPTTIGNLTALRTLGLTGNHLTGTIPSGIGNLAALQRLEAGANQLTGVPPEIGNLTALYSLWLHDNQISSLPPEVGNLHLSSLWLHRNPLSGEVPASLAGVTHGSFTFYDTNWCVPAAGVVPTWLTTVTSVYGTGLICGEDLGSLGGSVTTPTAAQIAGVEVNLYRSVVYSQWQHISTTHTMADGTYQFADLGQGIGIDYRVRFVDPAFELAPQYYSAKPTIGTADVITITPGVPRTGIDAVLALPAPPAAGVETETGSVVYNPDGTAQIAMPRPDPSDITVTRAVTCTVGVPSAVTLTLSIGPSYPMASLGGDLYRATVPGADLTANATLSVVATCGVTTTQTVVGYVTLYDPSGIISDEDTGLPVAGATVTLYQVPGWLPRTSPDDTSPNTCESNLSKDPSAPWSQPAPTDLGVIANAEVTAFAPTMPYQVSTIDGYYGWNVPQGCWYVTVAAEGYAPLVSPVVGVPPAVTDLDLALAAVQEGYELYLPLVVR